MEIRKSRLGRIAKSFLDILEREEISSLKSLKDNVNKRFDISKSPTTFIGVVSRPSNLGSIAYRASYTIHEREGIPIELVFNERFGYFQVIVKSQERIPGFEPFPISKTGIQVNGYGNLMQYKAVFCENLFSEAKKELEELTKLE